MPIGPTPTATVTSSVPGELEVAIQKASDRYAVPKDLLEGIWRIESGGHYPNPYVNSSGYGGLFGTKHWNTSTQDQANTAAQVLATGLARYGGNVSQALSYYNSGQPTGGYTSVPGETTFGVLPRKDAWLQGAIDQGRSSGIPGAVTGAVDTVTGPIDSAVSSVAGAVESVPKALKFLFSYRFLEILGGGLLLLLGLYLLAQQFRATQSLGLAGGLPQALASETGLANTPTSKLTPAGERRLERATRP